MIKSPYIRFILFATVLLTLNSCGTNHTSILEHRISSYNFSKPEVSYFLPDSLDEISGISFMNSTQMGCIHDERGTLYIFDVSMDTFVKEVPLVKDGDYEDLAFVDHKLYILNSKGNLLSVANYLDTNIAVVEKLNTTIKKNNDTEGLCYDKTINSLLVASKKSAGKDMKGKKGIFAYSLTTGQVGTEPFITLDIDQLKDSMSDGMLWDLSMQISEFFSGSGEGSLFQPAGIAIHPITHDYYILSSANRLLLILTPQRVIKNMIALPTRYFYQPEGITFAPNGDLYICTEKGKMAKASIVKYAYRDTVTAPTEIKLIEE